MTLSLARDVYQSDVQPSNQGDTTCKKLVEHYAPFLEQQGADKAKMWLRNWEARLERIRANDAAFDRRLAEILHEPLPPAKPPLIHRWIETTRRDDRQARRFQLNPPSISFSKRHTIRVS